MKNTIIILFLVLTVFSCQQQKIGFIDNGEVINNYQEKIDLEARFKIKDDAFKKKTDSLSQAFQLEAQEFQLKVKKVGAKKAQELYDELAKKQQILQQRTQMEQQQIQASFQTEIDSVLKRVTTFVTDYGKKQGYDFIFGKNEAGSVMFGKDAYNLTKEVTDALNEKYKK